MVPWRWKIIWHWQDIQMAIHAQGTEISIWASWSQIHGLTVSSPSVHATTIKSKKEDYEAVCNAVTKIYGKDIANKDWTCSLVRFVPLSMLRGGGGDQNFKVR